MTKWVIRFATSVLCVMLLSPAFAQTSATGLIVGRVTDPSGALIPGATATITSLATGAVRHAQANAVGTYTVPLLPPGNYLVSVSAQGFKTLANTGIAVHAATTTTVNAALQLGQASQTVTVEAGANMLKTESSANGGTINQTTIVGLPLVNRNYTQILQLNPGVASPLPNAAGLGNNTVDINANGGRATDNSYEMDGVDVTNIQKNQTSSVNSEGSISVPSPDAIAEFRVQTSQYDAAYGHGSGANVDVITKSGGNRYHGDLFEFVRNNVLNANDFFLNQQSQARPDLKQNQFGGTFGGPILHNKLFFFGSYQGTYQIDGEGNSSLRSIILPVLGNSPTSRTAQALGAEFAGETGLHGTTPIAADGSNINPVALALINYKLPNGQYLIPAPQSVTNASNPDAGGFSSFSVPSTYSENQILVNMDWTPSAKQHVSEKYFWSRSPEDLAFSSYTGGDELPGSPVNAQFENDNLALKYSYIFTPNLINEVTAGQHRIYGEINSGFPVQSSQIGMTPDCDNPTAPTIGTDNLAMGGSFDDGQSSDVQGYNVNDQLSYLHGEHNIEAGFSAEADVLPFSNWASSRGEVSFSSFPDFLLGLNAAQNGSAVGDSNISATSALCGIIPQRNRVNDYASYVQDNWTVTSHLTVNLGMRWEIFGQSSSEFGQMVNVWPSLINNQAAVSGSTLSGWVVGSNFPGAVPAGVVRNNNKTFAANGASSGNLGPRLGFAWNPAFAKNAVLRGGAGVYYARTSVSDAYQLTSDMPYFIRQDNSGSLAGAATFQNPWGTNAPPASASDYPLWIPRSYTSAQSPAIIQPDWAPPLVEEYSLNLQYSITPSTRLQVGYVGNHASNIEADRNLDQATLTLNPALAGLVTFTGPTTGNLQDRRPYLGFSSLGQYAEFGIGNYNSLQVTLDKRISHGIQFGLAYTYSKALADVTGNGTFQGGSGGVSGDNSNPMQAYGPSSFNIPQRLVTSFLWDFPSPSGHVLAQVAGGWALSGVLTLQDGEPVTFSNSHITNIYGGSSRAELCPGFTYADLVTPGPTTGKLTNYFNSNALVCLPPAIGNGEDWGDSGVGIAYGPGEHNIDLALMKDIAVPGEHAGHVQIRGEFYNATNTPQFNGPGTNVATGSFGHITSTSVNPRLVQLGIKYVF
ncbi:MAG: TonB-dependent receptor domain-containing protein [Terriglobales bacterium]